MLRSLTFFLMVLLLMPVVSRGQSESGNKPTRLPIPESILLIKERTEFYGMYIQGHKVGWMKSTVRQGEFEGRPAYVIEVEGAHSIMSAGEIVEGSFVEQEYFSAKPPYEILGSKQVMKQGDFLNEITVHCGEEKFTSTLKASGQETKAVMDAVDYTFADAATPESWCLTSPKVGDTIFLREMDWEKMKMEMGRHTIKELVEAENDPNFLVEYESADGDDTGELLVDSKGIMLEGLMGGGAFKVKKEEVETAMKLDGAFDVFEAALLRIDEPLGDPTTVVELELDAIGEGAKLIPSGGMQTVTYDEETKTARLKIVSDVKAREEATRDEIDESLANTVFIPCDSPKMQALALKAVGRAKSVKAKVQRLVNFVDRFIIDDMAAEPPTVLDLVETRRGDCTEHSDLFVTLARSLGIPARVVNGFIYGEDSLLSFGGHAWCEVVVDGKWYPVDPTWGETLPNATHVKVSSGDGGSNDLKVMLGGLKLKVISVKHGKRSRKLMRLLK